MKKLKRFLPLFLAGVILLAVAVVALRYNVYPYLFCGKNNDERKIDHTYTSENIEDGEGYAVMLDIRLDRFSRYKNGGIYQNEESARSFEIGNVLLGRGSAEYEMRQNQLDGMYIAETGMLAEQFQYVVLQKDYQLWLEEEERHIYTVYVDLGPCYWYLYTLDANILEELRNTSSACIYISEGDKEFTEDEKIVLWK